MALGLSETGLDTVSRAQIDFQARRSLATRSPHKYDPDCYVF